MVGFPAGQAIDIVARIVCQWLWDRLGQQFVVENRPGAGGNIATDGVIRSAPDGYTLLVIGANNAINATLYDNLTFNAVRDLVPIAGIYRVPQVMVVNPDFPAKTVGEFISYAKANPGKINVGSGGNGSVAHVTGELFKMMTGTDMQHVPYRGSPQALTDLIGGQVQVMFANLPSSIEHPGRPPACLGGDHDDALEGFRTCPPSANPSAASRPARLSASARRKARLPRSSRSSTARSMPASPMQTCRRASPRSAAFRCGFRQRSSASSSPTKPRNGARPSSSPAQEQAERKPAVLPQSQPDASGE